MKLDPEIRKAKEFIIKRQYDNAENILQSTLDKKPDYKVHVRLGRIHKDKSRYDKAEEEFKKAKNLSPNNIQAYSELGSLYKEEGRLEFAIRELKE